MIKSKSGKEITSVYIRDGKEIIEVRDNQNNIVYSAIDEIYGSVPLSFMSRGGYLKDYRIYGNTVQNGTPTPENPVEVLGCGVRTENLAPPYADLVSGYIDYAGNVAPPEGIRNEKASQFFSVYPNTTYTFSFRDGLFPNEGTESAWCGVGYYDANYKFIARYTSISGTPFTNESPSKAKYARISYRSFNTTESTVFVEGSTSPDHYIPYGYKIPVTVSDGTTTVNTPVYIGSEPLYLNEYVSYGEQQIYKNINGVLTPIEPPVQLPALLTLSGTKILTADTTVQPSEIYIKGKIKSLATHMLIDSENQILISSDNHQLVTKEQ